MNRTRNPYIGKAGLTLAMMLVVMASAASAAWTEIALPPLSSTFAAYRNGYLPDGRFLFGTGGSLSRQNTLGGNTLSSYSAPQSWDPSFVTLFNDSLGVIGAGGFSGPSQIFTFDPSDLDTVFAPIPGLSIQNYSAEFQDAGSLLVGGNNGTGGSHAISYVTLDGATNKVIIDDISTFSGAFAKDAAGNLFVSDNDDLSLYKFTAAQITNAILSASPLSITDGVLVTTLNKNGSIAVDSQGRIWSSGFQSSGIDMFDPSTGTTTAFVPGFDNSNYIVSTFSDGITKYVGYLNAEGFSAGDALNFGYESDVNLVPEPSGAVLLLWGFLALLSRRKW